MIRKILDRIGKFFSEPWQDAAASVFEDPRIGRRFCKVEMNDCMASTRGKEYWGVVIAVGESRTGAYETPRRVRNLSLRNIHNSWLLVRYEDGSELWEPKWWCFDRGAYLEYQI